MGCGFVTVAVTCRSTATSRRRAPPDRPAPHAPTTTRGPAAATSGAPRRLAHDTPFPPPTTRRRPECWISNSTRSRKCSARRCVTCWPAHCSLDVVRADGGRPHRLPAELWAQLGELDLIGLLLPEEYGGSGMTLIEGVALYEELGRALAPTPHFVSAVLAGGVLAAAGSAAQKERWLRPSPRVRRSSRRPGSSPRTASRPAASSCGPTPERSGFRLNGVKRHVAFAVGGRPAGGAGPHR